MPQIAICDDNETLCWELEDKIKKICNSNLKTVDDSVFYSGETLINYIKGESEFDIIFLDIEMGVLSGVDVGKILREEMQKESLQIIYISAKESYAMDLFDIRPMNFLIKPINNNKLEVVLMKAFQLLHTMEDYFTYTLNKNEYRQPIHEIIYFESIEKRIRMVLGNGEFFFYERLKNVEEQLCNHPFIHIHKSYLVNYDKVIRYEYDKVTLCKFRFN